MSRKRRAQADWVFADPDSDDGRPPPEIRMKHTQYNLAASGSISSQTSYIAAPASPKKGGAPSTNDDYDSYNWNTDPAPLLLTVENYPFIDPEYQRHLDLREPDAPRRKRTFKVS